MTLPTWMRRALFATALMNIGAAVAFFPSSTALRALAGFPAGEHPVYLGTVFIFVLLFGLGYLWTAMTGRADRLFIALSAAGKLSFFTLLVWCWFTGSIGAQAVLTGSGDLVFALLFFAWLASAAAEPARSS